MEFEKGGTITAELLLDKAPKTCELICDGLPHTDTMIHAMWAGEEIFFTGYPITEIPPLENPAKRFDNECALALVNNEAKAFCIFYGPSIPRASVDVDLTVTYFATVIEKEQMVEIGKRIRRSGVEKVNISLL